MSTSYLLRLPNEILIYIFSNLDAELYSLATLSRRLHYVALPIYFVHHQVPVPLNNGELFLFGDRYEKVLPALRIAPFVDEIKCIRCAFNEPNNQTLKDIQQLTRLVSKLRRVIEVSLDFGRMTDYWTKATNGLNWTIWTNATRRLLCCVVESSCSSLTVENGESVGMLQGYSYSRDEQMEAEPEDRKVSSLTRRSLVRRTFGKFPGYKTTKRTADHEKGERIFKAAFAIDSLCIRSSMLCCPDFSDWTISVINSSPVRKLFLETPWLPTGSVILPRLFIPKLSILHIHCSIEWLGFQQFLIRHREITELSIDSDLYVSSVEAPNMSVISRLYQRLRTTDQLFPRLPTRSLVNLTSLRATPAYLVHFLSPTRAFPNLQDVTILLHVPCNHRFRFVDVDRSLCAVERRLRETRLSLKLFVECDHVHWMDLGQDNNPNSLRHEIINLELNIPCSVIYFLAWWHRADIASFPACISRFPKLQCFSLVDWPYKLDDTVNFVQFINDDCPWIDMISINGVVHDIKVWLAMGEKSQVEV